MKQAKLLYRRKQEVDAKMAFTTAFGVKTSAAKQRRCTHDWQQDGQTMTAIRWTCSKCGKSDLRG